MNRNTFGKILWMALVFSVLFNFYQIFIQKSGTDNRINAVLWFQNAGEMRALSYQAFNLARMKLDQDLNSQTADQKLRRAVVVDVDESILDNSSYTAKNILNGKSHPVGWLQWIESAEAKPMPGSVEFLQYADSREVSIFYITNRKDVVREATIRNLKAVGFPVKNEYVMMQEQERSKEFRRQKVLENHRIVLLIGDNLRDFDKVFETANQEDRNNAVDRRQKEFGEKFIVLPNPIYGDWKRIIPNDKKFFFPNNSNKTIL